MKFTMTAYDVCDEGWVKTVFEVEAPTREAGERFIKKHLSKLFRSFPIGELIDEAVINWAPNVDGSYSGVLISNGVSIYTPTTAASGYVPTIGVAGTYTGDNQFAQLGVLSSPVLSSVVFDFNQQSGHSFTVTNSSSSSLSVDSKDIQGISW